MLGAGRAVRERRERPEGWRTLKVGDLELWWTVGAPRVTAKLPGEAGDRTALPSGSASRSASGALVQAIAITIAVERADGSGKKLVATVRGRRALCAPVAGFRDAQTIAVEPASVRRLVELAAPRGSWPTGTGTLRTDFDLPQLPLPTELAFRPEHLDGLALVWAK